MKISEEITIELPPGAVTQLEEIVKDWKSEGGHTPDTLKIKVQWFIMHCLDDYRKWNKITKDEEDINE